MFEKGYAANQKRRRHVLTNPTVEVVSSSEAVFRAYEQLYLIDGHSIELALTGIYVVQVKREDDDWKIVHLQPRLDIPYELADSPAVTSVQAADGLYDLVQRS